MRWTSASLSLWSRISARSSAHNARRQLVTPAMAALPQPSSPVDGSSHQQQGGGYETDCTTRSAVREVGKSPATGCGVPQGYRDWHLISVKRLTGKQLTGGGELKQLRA